MSRRSSEIRIWPRSAGPRSGEATPLVPGAGACSGVGTGDANTLAGRSLGDDMGVKYTVEASPVVEPSTSLSLPPPPSLSEEEPPLPRSGE